MGNSRESILFSSIRSFFVSFFAIMGLGLGILMVALLIGSIKDSPSTLLTPETTYTPEIVANADGARKEIEGSNIPVILKLNISGVIGTEGLNMNSFRTQLMESREGIFKDRPVKALLLHIESPGGTVVDADGIYRAIKAYKEKHNIPVYAYVDGLCASGGMYIAAAADKIYASDVSLIGSIGVISPPIFNFSKTMDKLGVEALTLSAGIGKDDLNSFRPWKEDEGHVYKKIIDYYYNHFVNVMTTNRSELDKVKLIEEYGANVFSAEQAKVHGFIDGAGFHLNDTVKLLAQAINVTNDEYMVIQLDKKTWYKELFGSHSNFFEGKIKHEFNFGTNLPPEIMNQFLYLYSP
jgi:protease-4